MKNNKKFIVLNQRQIILNVEPQDIKYKSN